MKLYVKKIDPESFDDLLYICPVKHLSDPYIQKGIIIKKGWFNAVYEKYGSPVRVCYVDDKPVSQILYFPEYIVPYIDKPRQGVLWINCIYNPYPEYHRLGCGRSLIESIISDIRNGKTLFKGLDNCRFLSARPFDTGEYYPMTKFFVKIGFKTIDNVEYFYEFEENSYNKLERPEYESGPEDRDKAYIFYEPWCEYNYRFAVLLEEEIRELCKEYDKELEIEILDAWLNPREYTRKGWNLLIVKSHIIKSFYGTEEFESELRNVIGG